MKKHYTQLQISVDDILDNKKFIIPQFQRNVVWKHTRRENFIRNIRNGDPFGVILVRIKDDRFELIDGLQRISTIKAYMNNSYDFLDYKDIDTKLIEDLIKQDIKIRNMVLTEQYLKDKTEDLQKILFDCLKNGQENWEVMDTLIKNGISDYKQNKKIINMICDNFRKSIDISGLQVFAINYTGPEENIPNVFYNLNTGGVQLTKYETFSALWAEPTFIVEDDEILKHIEQKYINLEKTSDLEVNFDIDLLRSNGISLFEYCYSLSGILRDKKENFHLLVGENKKSTDPLGFELLSLLLDLKVNRADELYNLLKDTKAEFLINIKNVLKESMQKIVDILKPTILGLNKKNLTTDSTYMVYHILISYIKENYHIDISDGSIMKIKTNKKMEDLKKFLPIHYLHDNISDFWKQNRQVIDLSREIENEESRTKYWCNISFEKWESALQFFFGMQFSSTKTIPFNVMLFIDFFTKLKKQNNLGLSKYFIGNEIEGKKVFLDFEHIIPKAVIEKKIDDLPVSQQSIYPVSSLGNVCYLTSTENRSKKDKTIYEFSKNRPSFQYNEEYLDLIIYPTESELKFMQFQNAEFRDKYVLFLKNRLNTIRNEFIELMKKY